MALNVPMSLYIARAKGTDRYAFGATADVQTKLWHLQQTSPVDIELVHELRAPKYAQVDLESRFEGRRYHGPWFTLSSRDFEALKEHLLSVQRKIT